MTRYLFGPLLPDHVRSGLTAARRRGECRTFGPARDPAVDVVVPPDAAWGEVLARLPAGWEPEFVAVWAAYADVPPWVWNCPLPTVALAADWNLLGHTFRATLPRFDRVLTDRPGVAAFRRHGIAHARAANLFGLGDEWLEPTEPVERDVDVLFVGNLHPAVQRQRNGWLGRLARLGDRYRVRIATGVFGGEYQRLLRRARAVFNRSIRGEANQRAFEAVAAGAALLQEAGNAELPEHLTPGEDYLEYTAADLEAVVERAVGDATGRAAMTGLAAAKLTGLTFAALWDRAVAAVAADLDGLRASAARRCGTPVVFTPAERAWLAPPPADPVAAAAHFEAAHAGGADDPLTLANLAATLAAAGRAADAVTAAHAALAELAADRAPVGWADLPPWPPAFDAVRVGWEMAGWDHPADKRWVLAGRLHALLADLTGDLAHYHGAVLAAPDDPANRSALGCALARAGRPAEGVPHLLTATETDPFDRAAARATFQALADAGADARRAAFARDRQLLHRAAPDLIPVEDWFREVPPTGGELASVVVLCCNELAYTRLCLESVLAHTRRPFELILVDNGSTDGTAEYLSGLAARPEPERVRVVTNPRNLGYPAGVNRGLTEARGEYVVLLNNDTVVSAGWLGGLTAVAAAGWPAAGLVGAVSNFAGGVQQVPVSYASLDELPRFAAAHRLTHRGRVRPAPMLSGFCLLLTRAVADAVGGLDERFGLGFFDDDDLCRRATAAGFRLAVADGVFVHHFGSRTFLGLGVDTQKQLRDNQALFRAKWKEGESETPTTGPAPLPAEPRGGDNPVSLTMIVRDEEHNLAACLDGFRPLVGELVVVDTGSTDRTKQIAARYGARVSDFPWVDDFAAARNEALRHATRPWALWADADDRIDPPNAAKLAALIAGLRDENAAYVLSCECVPEGPGLAATAVDHVRLFRADPRVRWRYRVHEQILPALRAVGADVRWSGVSVRHVGYVDPAVRARKRERDVRLLRLELAEHPDDPFALFNLGAVLHEAGDHAGALPVLERSLALSHPQDSIVRKLYALVAQCHARLGAAARAVGVCEAGRGHYPDDAELLFLEAGWRREAGDPVAAERLYRRLVGGREGPHFASVDTALRGHKGRHNLALAVLAQGRVTEADELLRQAVGEEPAFLPAWMALAELAARAGDRAECGRIADRMRACGPDGRAEAARLLAALGSG